MVFLLDSKSAEVGNPKLKKRGGVQISYNLKKCSKTTWPGVAKLKRLRLLAQGTRRRGALESGRESAASRRRPFPARTGEAAGPARGSASLRTSGSFRGSSDADRCEELRISCSMLRGLRDVHSFCIASLAAASHLLIKMRADILAHIWCWWTPPVEPPSFFAFKSRSMRPR